MFFDENFLNTKIHGIFVPVDVSILFICLSKGIKLTSNCNGLSIVIPFSFGRRKAEVHVVVSMFPRSTHIR